MIKVKEPLCKTAVHKCWPHYVKRGGIWFAYFNRNHWLYVRTHGYQFANYIHTNFPSVVVDHSRYLDRFYSAQMRRGISYAELERG